MYKEFFGLKERPFGKTPDPHFLYLGSSYQEALARLEYAVEEKEIAVLTGDVGSGKTTLSRVLLDRQEENDIVLIINPRLSPTQLLREIASKLDLSPKYFRTDIIDQINTRLYDSFNKGKTCIIIIDEAQLIPGKPTFDEIRLLTNFQLDTENLLSIILIGQPELKERLAHPTYRALRQRIGMWYDIKPLSQKETIEYIKHRLKVAGCNKQIFPEEASILIHKNSGGIPRVINNLCTNALLHSFGKEENPITTSTIKEVLAETIL